MDFIDILKHKRVKPLMRNAYLRKIVVWAYEKMSRRQGVALIPEDAVGDYSIKELQKIIKRNRGKDFFYLNGYKIPILRPRIKL